MRHPELPRDVAGPHPVVRQLHDPLPDDVGQGAAVDEHPAQLVHTAVACAMIKRKRKGGLVLLFLWYVWDCICCTRFHLDLESLGGGGMPMRRRTYKNSFPSPHVSKRKRSGVSSLSPFPPPCKNEQQLQCHSCREQVSTISAHSITPLR